MPGAPFVPCAPSDQVPQGAPVRPAGLTAPVGPLTFGDHVAPVASFAPGEPTKRLIKVESLETKQFCH